MEITGEATGFIPLEIQDKYAELAWLKMHGMQNIVTHEYFEVSLLIVCLAIDQGLTPLAEESR